MKITQNDLVRSVHRAAEKTAKRMMFRDGVPRTCRRGCFACCFESVHAEKREAVLIATRIQEMPEEDQERIKENLKAWVKNFTSSSLFADPNGDEVIGYRKQGLPCPLLKDGECSVYEDRPLACRLHMAIGPREYCDDLELRPDQKFALFTNNFLVRAMTCMIPDMAGEMTIEHLSLLLWEVLNGERLVSAQRFEIEVEKSVK